MLTQSDLAHDPVLANAVYLYWIHFEELRTLEKELRLEGIDLETIFESPGAKEKIKRLADVLQSHQKETSKKIKPEQADEPLPLVTIVKDAIATSTDYPGLSRRAFAHRLVDNYLVQLKKKGVFPIEKIKEDNVRWRLTRVAVELFDSSQNQASLEQSIELRFYEVVSGIVPQGVHSDVFRGAIQKEARVVPRLLSPEPTIAAIQQESLGSVRPDVFAKILTHRVAESPAVPLADHVARTKELVVVYAALTAERVPDFSGGGRLFFPSDSPGAPVANVILAALVPKNQRVGVIEKVFDQALKKNSLPVPPVSHQKLGVVGGFLTGRIASRIFGSPKKILFAVFELQRGGVLAPDRTAWSISRLYRAFAFLQNPGSFVYGFVGKSVGWALKRSVSGAVVRLGVGGAARGAASFLGKRALFGALGVAVSGPVGLTITIASFLPGRIMGKVKGVLADGAWVLTFAIVGITLLLLVLLPLLFSFMTQGVFVTTAPRGAGSGPSETIIPYMGPTPVEAKIGLCPVSGGMITREPGEESHAKIDAYDIAVPEGSPVVATHDGYVASYRADIPKNQYIYGNFGNYVRLAGTGYYTTYAHLWDVSEDVVKAAKSGALIKAGTVIGRVDATGWTFSTTGSGPGVHLHYQYNNSAGRSGKLVLPAGCAGTK